MDNDAILLIHPVIFIVSIIGIIVATIWMSLHKDHWLIAVPPLSYFLHVFIFNVVLLLGLIPWEELETWSGIVRLHSLFLFIALIIFYPIRKK